MQDARTEPPIIVIVRRPKWSARRLAGIETRRIRSPEMPEARKEEVEAERPA